MKKINTLIAVGLALVFVTSCSTSEGSFNKRKYTKGVFLAKKDKVKKTDVNESNETFNFEEVAVVEENEVNNTVSNQDVKTEVNDNVATISKSEKKEFKSATKAFVAKAKSQKKEAKNQVESNVQNTASDRTFGEKESNSIIKNNESSSDSNNLSNFSDLTLLLLIIITILLPPLGVAIATGDILKTLICLLLTILLYLPGLIYGLIVVLNAR